MNNTDVLAHDPMSGASRSNSGDPPSQAPQWSVVVIARNEEGSIANCLDSVLHAFRERSYELIFVDSASTDHTVSIAARFPAKIIRIPPSSRLSPSLGRHIGSQQARGQLVLFLDGDCTLNEQWLGEAERVLAQQPDLAGIAGERVQVLPASRSSPTTRFNYPYPETDYTEADFLSGSAVYTQRALQASGGFNPLLRSCEEAELGARLRKAGFRLLRLRSTMSWHAIKHANETTSELLRRIKRGFFIGTGQFVRYCYFQQLPVKQPFETIRRYVQFFVLLTLGLIAATSSILAQDPRAFGAWLCLMLAIFLAFVVRSRGVSKPAYYFLEWALTAPLVVWGFVQTPRTDWNSVQIRPATTKGGNQSDMPAV
jgi:GT2 family glycosyltransferase